MTDARINPNYIFEVSWEVCNKIGGIYTVISTKAITLIKDYGDKFIVIGPDVWRESGEHPDFVEYPDLLAGWREKASSEGLRVRIGRWRIKGSPLAILIDFTPFFTVKNEVFSRFWESYKLDSISGQWDYVEPSLFGYAAGKVIESYTKYHLSSHEKVVAHFHEWMTGAGLLYLRMVLPQVGCVFTTHATVIGRSIAGNRLPLYSKMSEYDGDARASEFNVISKHSMEKIAAKHSDCFTTVSDLTAKECKQFLQKEVDIITPNGFEDGFVPSESDFDRKRNAAREKLIKVSSELLGDKLPENTFFIAHSGRYEFKNKGIDLFIDSLGALNKDGKLKHPVVAFILIPANHYGPRKDLVEILNGSDSAICGDNYLTHNLHYAKNDSIINCIKEAGITNKPGDTVRVIFVPSYLNEADGIFNISYYDLLIGFDLTVFPSYYEPWGYTPLESLAFHIPTVTTSLTGFGLWARNQYKDLDKGIFVMDRSDFNDSEVIAGITDAIRIMNNLDKKQTDESRSSAFNISRIALWSNLIHHYLEAYSFALHKVSERVDAFVETERVEQLPVVEVFKGAKPSWKKVLVQQKLPTALKPLEILSKNLWWCWNQEAIDLFESIDPLLWHENKENPITFLDNIPYKKLHSLEKDQNFLQQLKTVYGRFKEYMDSPAKSGAQIGYFSMEFGLHDSLKIYSGGLGLLAGDYLKEASDSRLNIIGIGLLYRYGYFKQTLSSTGEQLSVSEHQLFSNTAAIPVYDENGQWRKIQIVFPGRNLIARIWQVKVGRIKLYLLDADIEENTEADRSVTHHLYGGNNENRLKQEILLGIGGIRALRAMNYYPDVYHCNEGHAAFTMLERLREYIQGQNRTYPEAVEIVRSSSLFTTHTPVPAGHDSFEENLMRAYMGHYPTRLKISWEQMMNLGKMHPNSIGEKFSMSCLAVSLSQEVNGVSRVHGRVSREMFADIWKGYLPEEVPIGHVTNGVHVPTWVAGSWKELYHKHLDPNFYQKQDDRSIWSKIMDVDQMEIWKLKSQERKKMIDFIREKIMLDSVLTHENPRTVAEIQEKLDYNALTIGFARRFATYKRAHLLFRDIKRLAEIVNNPFMPVQIIFAGKAHPADKAGQDLIKMIVEVSRRPEFIGKILFLPGYEISLAKKLLHGVDIWLNTPTRPLEASGTSGEKAVMNGVLHFSVLDGWWAEGYVRDAGWALDEEKVYDNNQDFEDQFDAETIYSLLEDEITPLFYKRDARGVPVAWVNFIQKSIAEICPEFTMNRMLNDYVKKYYEPLYRRTLKMREKDFEMAAELASWKKKMINAWNAIEIVSFSLPESGKNPVFIGTDFHCEAVIDIKTLQSEEIGVELVIAQAKTHGEMRKIFNIEEFKYVKKEGSRIYYEAKTIPTQPGEFDFGIRIFPKSELLANRQELPLVMWI